MNYKLLFCFILLAMHTLAHSSQQDALHGAALLRAINALNRTIPQSLQDRFKIATSCDDPEQALKKEFLVLSIFSPDRKVLLKTPHEQNPNYDHIVNDQLYDKSNYDQHAHELVTNSSHLHCAQKLQLIKHYDGNDVVQKHAIAHYAATLASIDWIFTHNIPGHEWHSIDDLPKSLSKEQQQDIQSMHDFYRCKIIMRPRENIPLPRTGWQHYLPWS